MFKTYAPTAAFTLVVVFFGVSKAVAGTLSCTVATSCPSGTIIYRMSSTTNAHAELASQSNYPQMVCCSGVSGLSNSCSGTYEAVLKLSGTTNAHVEQNSLSNYANSACLSTPSGGTVSVGYQAVTCATPVLYDTTLGSLSSLVDTSNVHVGDSSAYTMKVCASATGVSQSLTFSLSDNTIGFGSLGAGGARYATGDTNGSGTDSADAHTISAATNASSGYTITLNGSTLTCGACGGATVTAIGATAAASDPGNEQFGMRAVVNSGTGAVSNPYNSADWALDTGTFPDVVASGAGDGSTTQYGLRYIGNISANTETGSYSSVLTYTVTATF